MNSIVDPDSVQKLLRSLGRELFQTEMSASRHCRREARRLADTPMGPIMLTVAKHANSVLEVLPALSARHGIPVSHGGMLVGALFSELRERFGDHVVDAERSYRGTLLGMRHGTDLVRLVRHTAERLNASELCAFCDAWLAVRLPLVTLAEEQLSWFALHSERALELARPLPLFHRMRSA